MAAGRPILALAEPGGETADLVARSGAGLVAVADDEAAIEDALVSVVRLAGEGFVPVDRREFDGDRRAAELRAVLAGVVRGRSVAADGAHRSPTAGAPR
jgi:hypothetical protein